MSSNIKKLCINERNRVRGIGLNPRNPSIIDLKSTAVGHLATLASCFAYFLSTVTYHCVYAHLVRCRNLRILLSPQPCEYLGWYKIRYINQSSILQKVRQRSFVH